MPEVCGKLDGNGQAVLVGSGKVGWTELAAAGTSAGRPGTAEGTADGAAAAAEAGRPSAPIATMAAITAITAITAASVSPAANPRTAPPTALSFTAPDDTPRVGPSRRWAPGETRRPTRGRPGPGAGAGGGGGGAGAGGGGGGSGGYPRMER